MKGPVVVTGASGYVGSWLVMKLLKDGYVVRATMRDPTDVKKTQPLLDLPGADKLLTIWKGDLADEGSFDEAIAGCTAVFHVATPTNLETKDPENEMIKPTINGVLNIMKACKKSGSVGRVIFTSSAGTVSSVEHQREEYDESSWTDTDFCRRVKMTGWMYFVSKTLAEKAAWDFAQENGIHLISIIPTLVVGPFITTAMPPSIITALSLITGNEFYYSVLKQVPHLVHLDDVCDAHIYLLNHPEANGRYICSSHDTNIHDIARMIRERHPWCTVPQKFDGIDENNIGTVHFSSKKLMELGFKFKYTMEEMFNDAIQSCIEKKLIQVPAESHEVVDSENGKLDACMLP